LTGRENLEYSAALHFLPRSRTAARIDEVLRAVKLESSADEYVERYSTGMRQRLCLARAVLHEPAMLLLDEPTAGMDPNSATEFRWLIRDLRDGGTTVLLVTHDLAEAEELCDELLIVHSGREAFRGAPAAAKALIPAQEVVALELDVSAVTGAGPADRAEAVLAALAVGQQVAWSQNGTGAQNGSGTLRVGLYCDSAPEIMPGLMETLRGLSARAVRTDIRPVSVTDVFRLVTDDSYGG
jgi:ABC-2 type transport system ATP-binding protein